MNSLIEMLSGSWFAFGLVKSTIIAGFGGAFIFCVRQRDLASCLWAGLGLLLPVAFFSGLLPLSWKALPAVVEAPAPAILRTDRHPAMASTPVNLEMLPDEPIDEAADPAVETSVPQISQAMSVASRTSFSREQWLLGLWIAGGTATLIPGLLTLLASRRLRRSVAPEEIRVRWKALAGNQAKGVAVWISPDVSTPGITSALRPQVVLPESALHWETDRLMSVLRHELHHLERHDLALRWLGRLGRGMLWFHPAAWWVQSRLVLAQERAADEAVVAAGVPAADYAGHLLETAAESRLFPGIAMARRSQVGGRIHLLLARREEVCHLRTAAERAAAALLGALAMVLAIIGFSTPEAAGAEDPAELVDKGFRGPILDRNGVLLATSNPARMPEEIRSKSPVRWYPEGESHAHVTGYVFKNDKGEMAMGTRSGLEDSPSLADGRTLKLTIDARIQRVAARVLAARQLPGALMVMDPHNGDVLAMASWPSYDPNHFADGISMEEWEEASESKVRPLVNRAAQSVVPGSFAKLLTALAAAKADKADRVMHCGPSVSIGWMKISDWNRERNEELDLPTALANSCNTYFIPLAWEVGGEGITSIGKDFELGESSRFPWPGKATWPSREKPEDKLTPADIAMTAIGQSRTRIALIDMARVMSAVASGEIHPVRFTESDPAGDSVDLADMGIDGGELAKIRQGLTDLIHSPRGVGKRARIDGVVTAGITATGQFGKDGYVASFSGYAPAESPRYVVSALFFREKEDFSKEPNFSGGTTAAPTAAAVMKELLEGGS